MQVIVVFWVNTENFRAILQYDPAVSIELHVENWMNSHGHKGHGYYGRLVDVEEVV